MTRGANYFVEMEKRPNTKDVKQMGSSYVILATEMIKNFASWYPEDEEKEKSRFADYFEYIKEKGVAYPET